MHESPRLRVEEHGQEPVLARQVLGAHVTTTAAALVPAMAAAAPPSPHGMVARVRHRCHGPVGLLVQLVAVREVGEVFELQLHAGRFAQR